MIQVAGAVLGGGLGVATYLAYTAGLFSEVKITEGKVPERQVVYFEHEGAYQDLGPVFKKLVQDSSPFLRISNIMRISYDDSYKIKDPTKSRSVIGLLIEKTSDENGAKQLCTSKQEYKLAKLNESTSVNTAYEMKQKNLNLAFLAVKTRVYLALNGFVQEITKSHPGKITDLEAKRVVEIFKFDENRNPYSIEFNVPFGSGSNSYNLHSKPQPEHNKAT